MHYRSEHPLDVRELLGDVSARFDDARIFSTMTYTLDDETNRTIKRVVGARILKIYEKVSDIYFKGLGIEGKVTPNMIQDLVGKKGSLLISGLERKRD